MKRITKTAKKQPKITITFISDQYFTDVFDAVEHSMDHFDNGTWQTNTLRRFVGTLANAWNARITTRRKTKSAVKAA